MCPRKRRHTTRLVMEVGCLSGARVHRVIRREPTVAFAPCRRKCHHARSPTTCRDFVDGPAWTRTRDRRTMSLSVGTQPSTDGLCPHNSVDREGVQTSAAAMGRTAALFAGRPGRGNLVAARRLTRVASRLSLDSSRGGHVAADREPGDDRPCIAYPRVCLSSGPEGRSRPGSRSLARTRPRAVSRPEA
jgi:hypothetical protein